MRVEFISGDEACAEGALAAGLKFFAGYPITPASEIAEYLSLELPKRGGVFIQMEDEIASMGAVVGASLAGAKSMTATSGPGFSLKQENLGYACMAEVPCVVVDVQRGGPSTGLPTFPSQGDVMQARWGTHGDHPIIVLSPSTVGEAFFHTVKAFNLSEKFRNPVVVLMEESVGHLSEKVVFPEPGEIEIVNREKPKVPPDKYYPYDPSYDIPPLANFGEGYRFNVTGLHHDKTGFPTNDPVLIDQLHRRMNQKIERHKKEIVEMETEFTQDAEILILAYGTTARSARHAIKILRKEGKRIGLLRPITLWPSPDEEIRRYAEKVKYILVPEMNMGQYVYEVERIVGERCDVFSLTKVNGEIITPDEIMDRIKELK